MKEGDPEMNKTITEHRYDSGMQNLIKIRFAGFDYRVYNEEFDAEFLENLPAPPPLYNDIECSEEGRYIKCQRKGRDAFYSWFVPAKKDNMPLLVVIPGYESMLKSYPDVSDKYNMIFISPLGYSSPFRLDVRKTVVPLLYNTICGFDGGYKDWLMDALTVIRFIDEETFADTDKLIFAGTSNGGAMALILASYYGERCLATCADLPFLIGYSTRRLNDVIYEFPPPPDIRFRPSEAKKRLSLVDPEWHTPRLKMPVLITSSDIDEDCPQKDITALFHQIPRTTRKTYIEYYNRPHGYSGEFFKDMMNFLDEMKEEGCFDKGYGY